MRGNVRTFLHTFGLLAMMTVASIFLNYTIAVINYAYDIHSTHQQENH